MATLAEIRPALAARLDLIANLQTSAYLLANPTPPVAMVGGPDEIDWRREFGGTPTWRLPIVVYAGAANDLSAQKRLDLYLAPTGADSIRATVDADPTLGGIVDSIAVVATSGYRTYILEANALYLGAEFAVEIFD